MAAIPGHSGGIEKGLGVLEVKQVLCNLHDNSVHYYRMKNVTLSADENLIEQARLVAQARRTTLNAAFREWLEQYAAQSGNGSAIESLMRRLKHVHASGPYSRDEMNER